MAEVQDGNQSRFGGARGLIEPGSCPDNTGTVRRKAGVSAIRKKAVKGREQRRSRKDWRQFSIDRGENSEGQDPRSACGVE